MGKIILTACMLLVCICTNAQNVDSLKKLYFRDNSKLLYEIASGLLYTEPDSAINYANKIIVNKDNSYYSRAYDLIGTAYVIMGNYDTAKVIYELANDHIDFSKEDKNLIKALILLHESQWYSIQGKNKEAMSLLELTNNKLSYCAESAEKKKILMKFYSIKSDILSDIGQYGEAIELLNKAISICKELNEKNIEASNYNRLAKCYININDNFKSITYCEKAIEILKGLKNYNAITRSYMLIASNYLDLDSFKLAFKNICSAQSYAIRLNNLPQLAQVYNLKAQYFIRIGENKQALKVVDSALKINKEHELFLDVIANYSVIGNAYSQMGMYNKAIPFYEDAVKLLNSESEWVKSKIVFRNLIDAYVKIRIEPKKLNEALLRYDTVCNNVLNQEKISAISAQEIKYQTSLKEQQIKEQQTLLDLNTKKTNLILLSAFLGIISISSIFFYFRNRLQKKFYQAENDKTNLRYNLIKGKILPHFSGNVLNNIAYLFESNQQHEGIDYLVKYSELNKDLLRTTELNCWTLNEELDFLKNYIHLEKLRYGNKLDFKLVIAEGVTFQTQVPILITHSFCKNSIEHGIMSVNGHGILTVELNESDNVLTIKIMDDGIGMEEAKKRDIHSSGHGLDILNKQFGITNKNNLIPISFELISSNKGTVATVIIPKNYNFTI